MRKIITILMLTAIVSHGVMAQKLLKTADWGMTDETNKYCPEGTVVGTAAVAMGIVMNYHQWPLQGTGTHSYHDSQSDTDHSVDFESTSFDWNAMPEDITNCTEAQADVMADLFYKCAVAANSKFHSSKTSIYGSLLPPALIGYFKYMPTIRNKEYQYEDIKANGYALLKKEIDEGRPVIGLVLFNKSYSRYHAFVVDGYKDNVFHINWCRNGEGNGYYSLDNLNNSGLEFWCDPVFIVGITPNKSDVLYSPAYQSGQYINDYDLISTHGNIKAGSPFIVRQPGINFLGGIENLEVRAALVDNQFKIKELLSEYKPYDDYGQCETIECTSTIDAAEGDRLCFVAKEKDDKYWKIVNTIKDNAVWNLPATGHEPPHVSLTVDVPEGVTYQCQSDMYLYDGNPLLKFTHQFTIQVPEGTALQQTKIVEGDNTVNLAPNKIDGTTYSYAYQYDTATPVSIVVKTYGEDELVENYTMDLTADYTAQDAINDMEVNPDVIVGLTLNGAQSLRDDDRVLESTIVNLRRLDMSYSGNSTVEYYVRSLPYLEELIFPKDYSFIYGRGIEYYNPRLRKITLPQRLSSMEYGFFVNMTALTDLYAPFETMPTMAEGALDGVNFDTVTLHVPIGWKETFSQDAEFGKIKNIVEDLDVSGTVFEVDGIYFDCLTSNTVKVVIAPEGHEYKGDIVIPTSVTYDGKEYTVTQVSREAFWENTALTSVVIPSTVTSLEEYTFYGCTALESVRLPETLVKVPEGLFYNCPSLTEVNFPESLKTIAGYAFTKTGLNNLILPDGITSIGEYAFGNMPSIETVHLPASIVTVSEMAFYTPSEVIRMDSNVLPETLEEIGPQAFCRIMDWNGSSSIVLPKGIREIGDGAFLFCCLESVSLSEDNEYFCIEDNMLFNKEKTRLLMMFKDVNTHRVVPEGVITIDGGCSDDNPSIEQLVLPSTLESIGILAFFDCPNLIKITEKTSTPPYCVEFYGYYPFQSSFTTATLHVPTGSIDAYKEADTWKEFLNITEDEETAISHITTTPLPSSECYDLSGRKLPSNKVKGLYIEGGKVRINKKQ